MTASHLKNISILAAANFLVKPIWFVFITYICIREIGISSYGLMTASLALVSIVDGCLSLGASQFTIREIARDKGISHTLFSNFLVLRTSMAIVAIGVSLGVEALIGESVHYPVVLLAGLYVAARSLTDYSRTIFRANEDFSADGVSSVVEKILVIALGSIFVFSKPTVENLLLGMALGMLVAFAGTLRWALVRYTKFVTTRVSWSYIGSALPQSVPLGLASIFTLIYFRTDSFMIDAMVTSLAAGQYAIGFRILEALIIIPAIIVTVLLPSLSVSFDRQRETFRRMTSSWMLTVAIISSLIALGVFLGAGWIVTLIDSSVDAIPAIIILKILIWSFPLSAVNYILSTAFVASNRQTSLAVALGSAAFANVVLNAILIPAYGPIGAAAATIATQGLVLIVLLGIIISKRKSIHTSVENQ